MIMPDPAFMPDNILRPIKSLCKIVSIGLREYNIKHTSNNCVTREKVTQNKSKLTTQQFIYTHVETYSTIQIETVSSLQNYNRFCSALQVMKGHQKQGESQPCRGVGMASYVYTSRNIFSGVKQKTLWIIINNSLHLLTLKMRIWMQKVPTQYLSFGPKEILLTALMVSGHLFLCPKIQSMLYF